MQFDEKWAFVGKKQQHCDAEAPADGRCGDCWDHVAFDPEHRLVVAVEPGKRTAARCRKLVGEFHRRTGGRIMRLMTSDEYAEYKGAIQEVYGLRSIPLPVLPRPAGRPRVAKKHVPAGLNYAVVHKHRTKGRVVRVSLRVVFGNDASVAEALAQSRVSRTINVSFLERHNATDRHRNARKVRKSYRFSRDPDLHDAMTYFTLYSYNFCSSVRTLALRDADSRRRQRTPAMAAGLADHVWSLKEWITLPATQRP